MPRVDTVCINSKSFLRSINHIETKSHCNEQWHLCTKVIPNTFIWSLHKSFLRYAVDTKKVFVNPCLMTKKTKFWFVYIGYFEPSDLREYFEFFKSNFIFVIRKVWSFNCVKIKFLRHVEKKLIFSFFILFPHFYIMFRT